jgi:hypothetical protein
MVGATKLQNNVGGGGQAVQERTLEGQVGDRRAKSDTFCSTSHEKHHSRKRLSLGGNEFHYNFHP